MLGVDRLDMIKGIPQKILAFEKFLEENPYWRDKVVLLQIAVPTRTDVPECIFSSRSTLSSSLCLKLIYIFHFSYYHYYLQGKFVFHYTGSVRSSDILMAEWRSLIHKSIGRSLKFFLKEHHIFLNQTENLKILCNDPDLRARKRTYTTSNPS